MVIAINSVVFGSLSIGFGGILAIFIKKENVSLTCLIMSFAAGMMISAPCFEMLPRALMLSGTTVTLIGFFVGVIAVVFFDLAIESYVDKKMCRSKKTTDNQTDLFKSACIMFVATVFHDIPEGIAIGAGMADNISLGYLMGVILLVHNIPIGIAVGSSLLCAGVAKLKMIGITTLAGVVMLISCLFGYVLGGLTGQISAISLAVSSGAMLYVVFEEILSTTVLIRKDSLGNLFTVFGMAFGFLVIQLVKH